MPPLNLNLLELEVSVVLSFAKISLDLSFAMIEIEVISQLFLTLSHLIPETRLIFLGY